MSRYGPGHSEIFDNITNSGNQDEPGKSFASFGKNLIACTGRNKPASQSDGERIKHHEKVSQRNTFDALFIFSRALPVLQDGLSFGNSLGYFKLYDLPGTQWVKITPYPYHITDGK
jgi:hypothetical protein